MMCPATGCTDLLQKPFRCHPARGVTAEGVLTRVCLLQRGPWSQCGQRPTIATAAAMWRRSCASTRIWSGKSSTSQRQRKTAQLWHRDQTSPTSCSQGFRSKSAQDLTVRAAKAPLCYKHGVHCIVINKTLAFGVSLADAGLLLSMLSDLSVTELPLWPAVWALTR